MGKKNHHWIPFTAYAYDWLAVGVDPGEYTFAQFDLDDPDVRIYEKGRVTVRDRAVCSPITGDLENSSNDAIRLMLNATLDLNLNGPVQGTISIAADWNGLSGTFEGRFTGKFSDASGDELFEGKFQAQGKSGDFLKMKIKGTIIESKDDGLYGDNTLVFSGEIYNESFHSKRV